MKNQHFYREKEYGLTVEMGLDFEVEMAADIRAKRGYTMK